MEHVQGNDRAYSLAGRYEKLGTSLQESEATTSHERWPPSFRLYRRPRMVRIQYIAHRRLASMVLATLLLTLLTACGTSGSVAGAANTAIPTVTPAPTVVPPTATPNPKARIQLIIASFCQAV